MCVSPQTVGHTCPNLTGNQLFWFVSVKEAALLYNPRLRVLCVDDDEDSRDMLIALLGIAHIEAMATETAAEALALVETERFDLYVLDGWLPGVDGFELCRRMRAFDPVTPIIFFSGAAYEDDKRMGIEAGADSYVIKPDINGLIASIVQFVSLKANSGVELLAAAMTVGKAGTLTFGVSAPPTTNTLPRNSLTDVIPRSSRREDEGYGDSYSAQPKVKSQHG